MQIKPFCELSEAVEGLSDVELAAVAETASFGAQMEGDRPATVRGYYHALLLVLQSEIDRRRAEVQCLAAMFSGDDGETGEQLSDGA